MFLGVFPKCSNFGCDQRVVQGYEEGISKIGRKHWSAGDKHKGDDATNRIHESKLGDQ
jgi:hypothetical protein